MKSDARLLLNKKKWKNNPGSRKAETFKDQDYNIKRTIDARKILNSKRNQAQRIPKFGSFMRTKAAAEFIASQIRKEIHPVSKAVPLKKVQLSKDGNIIITSKSKNLLQATPQQRAGILQKMDVDIPSSSRSILTANKQYSQSPDIDDLEHTALEDLLDLETLPSSLLSSKSLPSANLSRQPVVKPVLERKTMIADQMSVQTVKTACAKVYVSNLHPSVSQEDVMELFGDVGVIKAAEMLMPGTAIIDFFNAEDAERACEIYHNRLLDGLPMKCYLQTQKPQPPRSAISQRLGNRIIAPPSPLKIPSLSSNPITTNSRSRYNPHNVKFTVKLA